MIRRPALLVISSACLLAATACGTTVNLGGGVSAGAANDGLGLGSATTTGTTDGTGLSDIPGSTIASSVGPDASASAAPGTDGGSYSSGDLGSGPGPIGPITGNARGVTPTTITLGVIVSDGDASLASSMGISGAGTLSQSNAVDAIVADLNKHGGIAGRKVLTSKYSVNTAQFVSNPDQTVSEVCTNYSQDHPVFAIITQTAFGAIFDCAAKMGSPIIDTGGTFTHPMHVYNQYSSYLFGPSSIDTETLQRLFVSSLDSRKFFEPWNYNSGSTTGAIPGKPKIGFIYPDNSIEQYQILERDLNARGYTVADHTTYTANVQAGLAATQAAVLRFRSEGITHVFGASVFFQEDAQQQNYKPRYAYLPGLGEIGAQNSPPSQMHGAMTIGWAPGNDVAAAQNPGPNPGTNQCLTVMKAAGLRPSNSQDTVLVEVLCDAFTFVRDALHAGGSATIAGLRTGTEKLGNSWKPAYSLAASFGPGIHSSVHAVRDMAWVDSCSCLAYTSKTNRTS